MATTKLMTAEDLAQMAEDGNRYDLIEGVLHKMSPPDWEHGEITSTLHWFITQFVRQHQLGTTLAAETGFLLARDPDTVLAPDIAFIRADRIPPRHQRRGFAPVAPDLVVEVLSPNDRPREVQKKVNTYLSAGVTVVWLVDPNKQEIRIIGLNQSHLTVTRDEVLTGGDVLPGLAVPLREIFPQE